MIGAGELSLWLALLMAVWSAALSAAGGALSRDDLLESSARGFRAAAAFSAIACAGLAWALASGTFELRYVALYTSRRVPLVFRISAFWAGRGGALLLWNAVFSCGCLVALRRTGRVPRGSNPGAAATAAPATAPAHAPRTALATAFATALAGALFSSAVFANPYVRLAVVPADGRALNPEVLHWTRVLDAPLFALGSAAAAIWLALCLAAVASRTSRVVWRAAGRSWPVVSVVALAAGLGLRLWWGYVQRGVVPSARAPFETPTGAAFFILLLLAMAASAFALVPRPRIGAVLALAGTVLLILGAAAEGHGRQYDVVLRDGETFRAADAWGTWWTFTSQGASRIERPNYLLTSVALLPTRAGVRQPFISGERREFFDDLGGDRATPVIHPGIRRALAQDVYVTVPEVREGMAIVRLRFNPLVSFVWLGGALLLAGRVVAFWPRAGRGAESA